MSKRSQKKGPVKEIQRQNIEEDEEENSTDSVEQAALEAAARDDNMFDQDSLMFGEGDEDFPLPLDDEVPESRESRLLSGLPDTSRDLLLDETDSTMNTPYGSPLSAISNFSSIQKWTGEVKKMLLEDQRESESRTKGWIFPLPESLSIPTFSSAGRGDAEGLSADVEGTILSDSEFDMMPTAEELAEKYSNELIEKEKSILQKETRILELEKSHRELKSTLDDCQKELKFQTESATSGVEKLKQILEEKDKSIMETSERLRKVTESYNSSEKRWKEQQEFLEKQIQKLRDELEANSSATDELEKLKEVSKKEKDALEDMLEKSKQEIDHLKQVFDIEKAELEEELQNLREEKTALEERLREEIQSLQKKLDSLEKVVEDEKNEKEAIKLELEAQEEKNRELITNLDEIKEGKDEIISQRELEKTTLEKTIASLIQEKEEIQSQLNDEKYELEVQVKALQEELEETKKEKVEDAPINFFRKETDPGIADDWLETKKSMEDRIAELELEKGNLLLQLVDVDDEQQDAEKRRQSEVSSEPEAKSEQVAALLEDIKVSQSKIESLEQMLEESQKRDTERIETEISTIAWEEKVECLQKQNESLLEELQNQRKAADELSGRYEELEKKLAEMEISKPQLQLEGLVEIDKSDGWSDDTPQLPDEGFTEDPQITELKEALEERQREIDELRVRQTRLTEELLQGQTTVIKYQSLLEEANSEKTSFNEKLTESLKQLDIVRQELEEKNYELEQQKSLSKSEQSGDGWGDDVPVLLDEGFTNNNRLSELKEELSRKNEELTTSTEKCRSLEDKLKKALKALKQKNDKLAELKNKLGENQMNVSTSSAMEVSMVQEPSLTKSVAFESASALPPVHQKELEHLRIESQEREAKIKELEIKFQALQQEREVQIQAHAQEQDIETLLFQRDQEINSLRNELSQLASTLNSKNEEMEQLMKTCGDMQKSLDEKVELLNDCVAKKDEEVRQAISQYEDILNGATLNVSHLTKEVEQKVHEISVLQGQLLEAQEALYSTQNEFESFRRDAESSSSDSTEEAMREIEEHKQTEIQLRDQINQLQQQLNESMSRQSLLSEALERTEAEKQQFREESLCIQNEYGNKNKELQVQISQLIDQLNERETAISVLEARLKESDDVSNQVAEEIKVKLEEKTKAVEQIEQALFVKTEECLRLEERLRETEERSHLQLEEKVKELEEQHRLALENFALQNSEDLERTCEQLANKNTEVAQLQDTCRQFQEQLAKLQEDLNSKCAEISYKDQSLLEVEGLKVHIQNLEATIASYTHALNAANADLNVRNEEVRNLQTICNQYEEKLHNSALTQDESKRVLQETQASLAQCQQDLTTYYNELQNSKVEVETLRKSCSEYQETIEKLNAQLTQTSNESSAHSTEVQNLNAQLARYQELEAALTQANAEVARCSSEVQRLNNQLLRYKDMESNLNKYLEDLNSATEELGRKNSELREMEKAREALETQIQSLESRANWYESESKEKDDIIAEKEKLMAELEAQVATLTSSQQEADSSQSKYVKELLEEVEEKNREISDLRFELDEGVVQERNLKKNLDEKEYEIQMLKSEIGSRDVDIAHLKQEIDKLAKIPKLSAEDESLAQRIKFVEDEKAILERKIDLLQNKLAEVESSEVKCYEDFSRLKILRTELEMDNLRMSSELEQLKRSLHEGASDPKYRAMENQIVLMTKTLEDRDKLCRDLMKNISELQESQDALKVQINDLQLLQFPPQYHEDSIEAKLLELESHIFSLRIDIDREKKIRELYEGLLFLATSKKQFESQSNKSTSGSWFGLGDLFSSPPPPPVIPRPQASPPRPSLSTSMQSFSSSHYGAPPSGSPFASTPARPLTPASPMIPPPMFDTPGVGAMQHQQQPLSLSPVPPITPFEENRMDLPAGYGQDPGSSAKLEQGNFYAREFIRWFRAHWVFYVVDVALEIIPALLCGIV